MSRLRRPVALAVAIAGLAAAAPASAHVFAVRGDTKIGAYGVRADGSLAGPVRAFGKPTSLRHTFGSEACRAVWPRHGLTVDLQILGGRDACEPRLRAVLARNPPRRPLDEPPALS